jgi:group I intron endonuclease
MIAAPSGNCYVGSAQDIRRRWYEHKSDLSLNKHHAVALQNACAKYGFDSLKFSVLLVCSKENLILYEQLAIDAIKPEYNSLPNARRRDGWSPTEETRRKMSESAKSRVRSPHSDETKKKQSEAHKRLGTKPPGRTGPLSEEHRKRVSEAAKRRPPRVQTEQEKKKRTESRLRYFAQLRAANVREQRTVS